MEEIYKAYETYIVRISILRPRLVAAMASAPSVYFLKIWQEMKQHAASAWTCIPVKSGLRTSFL